jgi:hypothetical protein
MGGCGVPELVQVQPPAAGGGGVLLEQDPGAVIAQASSAGVRAGVAARDGAPGQAARRGDRCGRSASARPWVMYRTSRFELPGSRVPDLPQQPLDRHRGVLGAALAQVVAVGVDERGPVLRGAPQPLGLLCAGVALDRVQGQVQAAGAFQQVPLPSRSWSCCQRSRVVSALPALRRGCPGPARGVLRDIPLGGLGQAMPQVPAVADLDRTGQDAADRLP